MKAKIFTVILLCCLCGSAWAQTLEGRVMDERNQPLEFANVEVYALPDTLLVTGTITDSLGVFTLNIPELSNSVIKVSLAGYETATVVPVNGQAVVLKYKNQMLGEVSIVGERKAFEMKRGNLVANVAGTILENEVNAMEILRKIPGMTVKNGELSSFLYGNPVIYINGKKVREVSEVKQLDVKNIKTVEVNTNPGAEYDASTGIVLLITTHKRRTGLTILATTLLQHNHFFNYGGEVKANYKKEKFNLFGQIGYIDNAQRQYIKSMSEFVGDTIWQINGEIITEKNSNKRFGYGLGVDYELFKDHEAGIKYEGTQDNSLLKTRLPFSMRANSILHTEIEGQSTEQSGGGNHYVNGYYIGRFNNKLSVELFADFLKKYNQTTQNTTEKSVLDGVTTNVIKTAINNTFWAVAPKIYYTFNDKNKILFGIEYSNILANSELNYFPQSTNNQESSSKEHKISSYLGYNFDNLSGLAINAGVRYELVSLIFDDIIDHKNSINRTYGDFFPNLNFSYKIGSLWHSLSYRSGITRPTYRLLNANAYYVNRFMYQEGNPKLLPEISHNIQYNMMYSFMYFSAQYSYKKDPILSDIVPVSKNIQKSTYINFDKMQVFNLMLNMKHKFWKFYTPSLTISYKQNFINVQNYKGNQLLNTPFWMIDFENNLELPKGYNFYAKYNYTSTGTSGLVYVGEKHVFELGLQKSFFNDKLNASLRVYDVFHKDIDYLSGTMHNINISNMNDNDNRSIMLFLVWRFNNYNKQYKGESAAEDELKRL